MRIAGSGITLLISIVEHNIQLWHNCGVGEEVRANIVQSPVRQIGIEPADIYHADIRDSGYPQVINVFNQTKSSGVRQVGFETNFNSVHENGL